MKNAQLSTLSAVIIFLFLISIPVFAQYHKLEYSNHKDEKNLKAYNYQESEIPKNKTNALTKTNNHPSAYSEITKVKKPNEHNLTQEQENNQKLKQDNKYNHSPLDINKTIPSTLPDYAQFEKSALDNEETYDFEKPMPEVKKKIDIELENFLNEDFEKKQDPLKITDQWSDDFDQELQTKPNKINITNKPQISSGQDAETKPSDELKQEIKINPQNYQDYFNRANTYQNIGQYQKALADYNTAIRLNPNFADAYTNRGVTRMILGDTNRALADFNSAIRCNPRHWQAYYHRGRIYHHRHHWDWAIRDFTIVIRIYPVYAWPYYYRAHCYFCQAKYDLAYLDYLSAIQYDHELADAYYQCGLIQLHYKNYKKAIQYFNKAITLNPSNAYYYNYRGLAYYKLRKYRQSIADYKKALKLNPFLYEAMFNLGNSYAAIGDYKKARYYYLQALQYQDLMPDNGVAILKALRKLSLCSSLAITAAPLHNMLAYFWYK
ncbi:MAG: tetratricopeptide repeat protein [candidate division WOR-3 bacterium]